MNYSVLPRLQRLSTFHLWLLSVFLASILTESIVAGMDILLHQRVSFDYLLTGFVTSSIVASLISAMIILFLKNLDSLNNANAELNTIVNALPVPLALFDSERHIMMLNPEFTKVFGYSREDIPTVNDWRELAFPDISYRTWVVAEWQSRLEHTDNAFEPLEIEVYCKNRVKKSVLATATPLGDSPSGVLLVLLYDISVRVRAMNALAESRNLLQAVIETIPVRVFWKDKHSRYLGCNSLFAKDSGADCVDEVIGKVDTQLGWREQADQYRRDDQRIIEAGLPKLNYEEPQTTPNGNKLILRTSKAPLRNRNGEIMGVLGVYDDITALKHIEDELWLTKAMVDKSKTAFYWLNPQGMVIYVNDYACQCLGYFRDELVGMYPWDFDPDFLASYWPDTWAKLLDEKIVHIQTRHRRKDGCVFPVAVTGHYVSYKGTELSFTFVQDITERMQLETELRIAATAFESQEGMIITDADTVILKINKSFTELTGYAAEDVVGRKMNLLKSGVHDERFFAAMWEAINQNGVWQGEIWSRRKNGDIFPEWLTITSVKGVDGRVTHFVGTMLDITARKAIEDHVHHLAHHDALTDLPNRTLLIDRLHQAIAQARREQSSLALLYLDLDKFKPVNDSFGHDIGDLLLKEVATRLQDCVKRETDTVARLGGDEFVILLSQMEQPADASAVAENILQSLSQPFVIQQHLLDISTSVGISVYPDDGLDVNALMKNADSAMYQAKCAGRGCFKFYQTSA